MGLSRVVQCQEVRAELWKSVRKRPSQLRTLGTSSDEQTAGPHTRKCKMRNVLRQLSTLIFALAFATTFAGTALAVSDGQILSHVKESGTLRVGMAEHMPAQFRNPATGQWEGFNVDMAKHLAKVLNVKLDIVPSTWASLIPGLQAGKYDIVMSDVYATPARALVVNFTHVYMRQSNVLAIRKDEHINDWHELNDPKYTFAEISGTASAKSVHKYFPKAKERDLVTDNEFAQMLELASGRANAVLYERMTVERFLQGNPNAGIEIVPDVEFDVQGASYAIRPGDYHTLAFLNTWIDYLRRQGTLKELETKWFINFEKKK